MWDKLIEDVQRADASASEQAGMVRQLLSAMQGDRRINSAVARRLADLTVETQVKAVVERVQEQGLTPDEAVAYVVRESSRQCQHIICLLSVAHALLHRLSAVQFAMWQDSLSPKDQVLIDMFLDSSGACFDGYMSLVEPRGESDAKE